MEPTYQSIFDMHKSDRKRMRYEVAMYNHIVRVMPTELGTVFSYCMDSIGDICIRMILYFDDKTTTDQMQLFFGWAAKMKKQKWEFEKFFREDSGTFSYKFTRKRFIILCEKAPNIDGCEIKKKEVLKEIYYSDCGELNKKF